MRPNRTAQIITLLAILAGVVAALAVPLRPPALGLDESWEQALIEATDSGKIFGREFIFTYGPLHQLATHQIGDRWLPLLLGRCAFSLAWMAAVGLAGLLRGPFAALMVTIPLPIVQAIMTWPQGRVDILMFSLCSLIVLLSVLQGNTAWQKGWHGTLAFGLLLLTTPAIALAPLVKLSFLGTVVPTLGSLTVQSLWPRPPQSRSRALLRTLALIVTPLASLLIGWSVVGAGSPGDLIAYLLGPNLDVVRGYTDAMAILLEPMHSAVLILVWLAASAITGLMVWRSVLSPEAMQPRTLPLRLIPALVLGWNAFVVFKASFVRHDAHGLTASLTCVFFTFMAIGLSWRRLVRSGRSRWQTKIVVVPLTLGALLTMVHARTHGQKISNPVDHSLAALRAGIDPQYRERQSSERRRKLKELSASSEAFGLPTDRQVSVDIFPWDISELLANRLTYAPRPIPQSYSVYTPRLQEINAEAIAKTPPEFVILRGQDIDRRLPLASDSPAIRWILDHYRLHHRGSRGSLVMRHTPEKPPATKVLATQAGELHWQRSSGFFQESTSIPLPQGGKEAWLTVDLKPGWFRKASTLLFQSPPVWIDYLDSGGRVISSHRVVPGTLRQALIQPRVMNNEDLLAMLSEAVTKVSGEAASIRFRTRSISIPFVQSRYRIETVRRTGQNPDHYSPRPAAPAPASNGSRRP